MNFMFNVRLAIQMNLPYRTELAGTNFAFDELRAELEENRSSHQ